MPVLSDDAVLVVGLGNPGPNYAKTRHNLGFMVADLLAAKDGATFKPHKKSGAEATTIRLGGRAVNLAKPRTFMNTSGPQVAALAKFFSVPPANVIVMHDELDLDFGTVRLKLGGGEGGHNGLRSVSQSLGTKDYLRVRRAWDARRGVRTRRPLCWRTLPRRRPIRFRCCASRAPMPPNC
ncbi:peptidyl-tRNA hydrolase [Mycobacteroides abscessus]|nr:peptidyl-tRNA hydrolase [Mycobacteroides abscessus]